MTRVKRGIVGCARRKKILKIASGFFGSRHRLFRIAKESIQRALVYSYRDRKTRKRFFRKLWIIRINAFLKSNNICYNHFIYHMKKIKLILNRKTLAFLIIFNINIMRHILRYHELTK